MTRLTHPLLLVLAVTVLAWSAHAAPVHQPSADPHGEHAAALALCPVTAATHQARESGDWSDPATWDNGIPTSGARVVIPAGVIVKIRARLEPALEWARVDGTLRFASVADTELRATTIVVGGTGRLQIGSERERVRPDRTAAITFTPRSADARRADAGDLGGGLIAVGPVQVYGAERRAFAMTKEPLRTGLRTLTFDAPPAGWQAGDELLFPASTPDSRDERIRIASVADGGRAVTLAAPLAADHVVPEGITSPVPVGNLTRNVVFASADPDTPAHRAHLMLMTHTGSHLSGVLFRGLGRTDTMRAHTIPERGPDGIVHPGDNPVGRYAVHFHLRSGASVEVPAQVFAGNAVVDSPKHGLVNHGGHVVAENNVTFAVHGSHFFSENGSEVGAFRNNLAVYSKGSGDKLRSRECVFDFGHGGHGFWAQSPGVVIENNFAFHHADAAYAVIALAVKEFGRAVKFASANLPADVKPAQASEFVSPLAVPFRFEWNAGGNCGKGLEIWNANALADHNAPSLVAGCQFWHTPAAGIEMPYTFNTVVRDTTVLGCTDARYKVIGVHVNTSTRFLTLERVTVAGYRVGFDVPVRGHTRVADCRFDNDISVRIPSPVQPGRRTILTNNTFHRRTADDVDYFLHDPDCKFNGDLSLLFDRDVLLVEDPRFPGETLYHPQQAPDAVPFPGGDVEQLRARTAIALWDEYGLAISGSLAPADTRAVPGIRGRIGPVTDDLRKAVAETARVTFVDDTADYRKPGGEYTIDQNLDRVRFVKGKPGEASGWRIETTRVDGRPRSRMCYVDATAPHFELAGCVKQEVHPDDVRHGIEICGLLHDEVGGVPTIKNMLKEFRDLKVDADGFVTVNYVCTDSVGNAAEHTYRFQVTEDAPRRGPNIGFYNQKQYMPPEEPATSTAAPRKRSGWWWWVVAGAAGLVLGLVRIRLNRQRNLLTWSAVRYGRNATRDSH